MIDTTSQDQDKEVADGQLSIRSFDDELADEISENIRLGQRHWSEWKKQASEDFDFYAGRHWDEDDARILEEQERVPVVFNRIVRTINAVTGLEVQNRQETRFYPRRTDISPESINSPTIAGYSDALNDANKWVRDQNHSEDEESEAFQDCAICGIGWTDMRMDYEVDTDGLIMKDRIDPLEMLVDPSSKKKNFEDAKWIAHIKSFSQKEVKEIFGDDIQIVNSDTFWDDDQNADTPHNADDAWMYKNNQAENIPDPKNIRVIRYQYYKRGWDIIAVDQIGQATIFDETRYKAAKEIIDRLAAKIIKKPKRIFYECFMVGKMISGHKKLDCNQYTFGAMTGFRDRNKNVWFGIVQLMKDPQRWANKWLSQIQYVLNSNSKGGVLYETGAFKNARDAEEEWAKPNAFIQLNPDGLSKIKEKEQVQYPDGIDRLLNYSISAINDIPGINLELMGMANRDQAIGLEQERKESGITVLATFFDSLRRYRKLDGKLSAFFIREYLADGRLIRIVGKEGAMYVPLIKDQLAFNYDIIVDDAPTSPRSKEKTFLILSQLVPMLMQAGIPMPPEMLDYAPLPNDLIQAWKALINQSANDPMQKEVQQIQRLMTTLAAMEKQAEIQRIGSETAKNYADADKAKSVANEQEALALQKFGVLQTEQQRKDQELQRNMQRKDLEIVLNSYRKLLEAQIQAETKLKIGAIDKQFNQTINSIQ